MESQENNGKLPTYEQKKTLSRLITNIENEKCDLTEVYDKYNLKPADSYVIGITGPPGTGKSTLIDNLIKSGRKENYLVGVVAIDPTSPFSGGAFLGDRIRMLDHSKDKGVFIRSMAARNALGGLAPKASDVVRIISSFGYNLIFVETVGVGQSEFDIIKLSDSVLVVAVPGLGDSIQTLKAGILEIADIFVVNMADHQGVDKTVMDLKAIQMMMDRNSGWIAPVVETIATTGKGIPELWETIKKHKSYLYSSDLLNLRRGKRLRDEVLEIVERKIRKKIMDEIKNKNTLEDVLYKTENLKINPHKAAEIIFSSIFTKKKVGKKA